jgi:uncharacterized protein
MPDIQIELQKTERGGRYAARIVGVTGEAELTYTARGPALVSADHTEAPLSMRGTGVALALVERLIADARAGGFKIKPVCPYVQALALKHPEWADVIA